MALSYRGLVKAGRRDLVVLVGLVGFRLGSAAKNRTDVTGFGPAYDTLEEAQAAGKAKYGKLAPVYESASKPAPVVKVDTPKVEVETVTISKPLGVLPPPDADKPVPLSDLTVPVLRGMCKAAGLKGYSKLAKAGLVEMLTLAKLAA